MDDLRAYLLPTNDHSSVLGNYDVEAVSTLFPCVSRDCATKEPWPPRHTRFFLITARGYAHLYVVRATSAWVLDAQDLDYGRWGTTNLATTASPVAPSGTCLGCQCKTENQGQTRNQ